jgi:hypothetical protein
MKYTIDLIWQDDPQELNFLEYDWIYSLLTDFELGIFFDKSYEIYGDNTIVILAAGSQKKSTEIKTYLQKFKKNNYKVGLIHLGDEWCTEAIGFYRDVNFIFRQYYRQEAARYNPNCFYLPIGYKAGFCDRLNIPEVAQRAYTWSFAGQPKGSRAKMLQVARNIPGGFNYLTSTFNDPKGMSTNEYANLLSQTVFALCPRGNFSVDTFRFYEALEAGAIPIVEDRGSSEVWRDAADPKNFLKPSYWRLNNRYMQAKSYWLQAYGADFPILRMYDWENLDKEIANIDVERISQATRSWWKEYKLSLIDRMTNIITATFFK